MRLNQKDKEWSILVRTRDGNKCAICGSEKYLTAHHLIPRKFPETKYSLENGLCLCVKCHIFGKFSAHKHPIWFAEWMKTNRQGQYFFVLRHI